MSAPTRWGAAVSEAAAAAEPDSWCILHASGPTGCASAAASGKRIRADGTADKRRAPTMATTQCEAELVTTMNGAVRGHALGQGGGPSVSFWC